MKLSVIIPAYNEKETLSQIINKVKVVPIEKEILVVDDGSTDGSAELLKKEEKNGIKVLTHSKRMGKGAAIRTALKEVTGDIVLIQDADLEYDPKYYPALIEPIVSGRSNVVYGSRILNDTINAKSSHLFYWGGRIVTFIANILYGMNITDEPTGYKIFRTTLLKKLDLKCNGFEFCSEVTAKLGLSKEKIVEVPITYFSPRPVGLKKIKWWDGFLAILTLIRYRIAK